MNLQQHLSLLLKFAAVNTKNVSRGLESIKVKLSIKNISRKFHNRVLVMVKHLWQIIGKLDNLPIDYLARPVMRELVLLSKVHEQKQFYIQPCG